MDGFITYLERQENKSLNKSMNKSLTFLAETRGSDELGCLLLTREGMFERASISHLNIQQQIIEALAPAEDEEIIVTFTKRKCVLDSCG